MRQDNISIFNELRFLQNNLKMLWVKTQKNYQTIM